MIYKKTDLVDHAHDVIVGPSSLVKVIRLLQHFAEPLGSDVPMGLGPTFDSGWQEGVAESEGGRGEAVGDGGVGVGVIPVVVPFLLQDKSMTLHDFFAQDHGQELVVGDVLDDGGVDVLGLLEEGLVVPVRVDGG